MVSSSSAWAHAVICDESTVHVCYCHNPFRYAWNDRDRTLASRRNPITRSMLRSLFRRWRQWDWIAAQRVDRYVSNSAVTAARVRRYLGRESSVLHPPVEIDRFSAGGPGSVDDHYVVGTRFLHVDGHVVRTHTRMTRITDEDEIARGFVAQVVDAAAWRRFRGG